MSIKYGFSSGNEFIIEDYDKAKTFASFLPGIAGVDGIPMWSFYVNRGQAMGSFGVKDKNGTIMEFMPASMMYRNIERQGFRTFIRKNGQIHEIFSSISTDDTSRSLAIEMNTIRITESNRTLGLNVTVTYFSMPGENYAAIVRKVEAENLGSGDNEIEILDGLPQILPFGVTNSEYQAMSNLMKAWFDVFNIENDIAFYKVRASTGDTAEVHEVNEGNFYLSFSSNSPGLIPPIYDMDIIFGTNSSLSKADGWNCPLDELYGRAQVPQNKVSGGFAGAKKNLRGKFTLCTVIGHTASLEFINGRKGDFTLDYINSKEIEARELVEGLVADTFTKTSDNLFNQYISQCYLDNLLRGGYPLVFKSCCKNLVYHVFSRKHGDMEREYNFFSLEPMLYSQGNGNFRDVNQNRRNDVLINPEVRDFNVRHFMSLIQADGYNPLLVKGCTFTFNQAALPELLELVSGKPGGIKKLLAEKFTPGQLMSHLAEQKAELKVSNEAFLEKVLENSRQGFEAEFGEGYWSDHWTYNMDLVDTYLMIYPDKKDEFLFGDDSYRFFHSTVTVLPRSDKYVLSGGKVRQLGAVHGEGGSKETGWLKTKNGSGSIYETNLFAKLVSLALMKFVNLDPYGMGIEMEGGRPGWNDALNGLPGLFGSGVGETAELKRIFTFLTDACLEFDKVLFLYEEAGELLKKVVPLLDKNLSGELGDFSYWDKVSALKEDYRRKIRHGIDGKEEGFYTKALLLVFQKCLKKLDIALEKSLKYGDGVYPTYFTYNAVKYELISGKTSPVNGYQNVVVTEFDCKPLPAFLEGPARILKIMPDKEKAASLCKAVKSSDIYDRKLMMYKTSGSLTDAGNDIGRLRAFTPGWLERESVFLHMEYKFLYAQLQAGLYDQFFEDMKTALIPFMKPEVYGRSTLENSSFIASSANPDEAVHGRGFVARLTGSTAEILSIWFMMMVGRDVFAMDDGMLTLKLNPILPAGLFDEAGRISFKFLGKAIVTYINPGKRNTYGLNGVKPVKFVLITSQNEVVEIEDSVIGAPFAEAVRKGEVAKIDVYLG